MYGVPRRILTDRGSNFVLALFRELCLFLGSRPTNTTAYRPQSNGANERTHRDLHGYLAMYLNPAKRETWDTLLGEAAWVHNSSMHSSLKASPFEVLFGFAPRSAQAWLPGPLDTYTAMAKQFQKYYGVDQAHLLQIRDHARASITRAQNDMLKRINVNAKAPQWRVGQLVLKRHFDTRTYVSRKWGPRYTGPFKIVQCDHPVACQLEDPATGKRDWVHSVYLKPYRAQSPPPPEPETQIPEPPSCPEEIDDVDEVFDNYLPYEIPLDANTPAVPIPVAAAAPGLGARLRQSLRSARPNRRIFNDAFVTSSRGSRR